MTDYELLKATLKILDKAKLVSTTMNGPQKITLEFKTQHWLCMTKAIGDRLAQPEPEPVATQYKYIDAHGKDYWTSEPWEGKKVEAVRYLYAAPQPEPTIDGWPLYSGLPQPEPKPVAFLSKDRKNYVVVGQPRWDVGIQHWTPLYTAPPQREWIGLTDEEGDAILNSMPFGHNYKQFYQAIEAKLKEKNGG